jgi:hypothetical protein
MRRDSDLVTWAALGAVLALVALSVIDRLRHPQLTETELFLRHWPSVIVIGILLAVALRNFRKF